MSAPPRTPRQVANGRLKPLVKARLTRGHHVSRRRPGPRVRIPLAPPYESRSDQVEILPSQSGSWFLCNIRATSTLTHGRPWLSAPRTRCDELSAPQRRWTLVRRAAATAVAHGCSRAAAQSLQIWRGNGLNIRCRWQPVVAGWGCLHLSWYGLSGWQVRIIGPATLLGLSERRCRPFSVVLAKRWL